MRNGVTRVVGGKPQATFYQQQAKFQDEVREYLETAPATVYNQTIQDEGTALTQRDVINFVGGGVSAADSGGKTVVTIAGGYSTVEDEGTPATQRTSLNFVGDMVAVTDSGGKTVATIDGKHGERTLSVGAEMGQTTTSSTTTSAAFSDTDTTSFYASRSGSAVSCTLPVPLLIGDRIKSVKMYGRQDNAVAWTMKLYKNDMLADPATWTQVGSTQTASTGADASIQVTLSGLTETLVTGTRYYVRWNADADAAPTRATVYGIEITYDRV